MGDVVSELDGGNRECLHGLYLGAGSAIAGEHLGNGLSGLASGAHGVDADQARSEEIVMSVKY